MTIGVFELYESHTAEYIRSELCSICFEWNIELEKVVAVTTDNDATMRKVSYDMFGMSKHIPCLAHTINLVVTLSLDRVPIAAQLISQVRDIVKFIKRSVKASDELRKIQKSKGIPEGKCKKLILDVATRWNSCFYMLERFVELSTIISNVLLTSANAPYMINGQDLECIKEVVELLRPFENLTKKLSTEDYITSSKVIPLIFCLKKSILKKIVQNHMSKALKDELQKELLKRFATIESSHILALSTALDPRFKLIHFEDPIAKSKTIQYMSKNVKKSKPVSSSSGDDSLHISESSDIWEKKIFSTRSCVFQ